MLGSGLGLGLGVPCDDSKSSRDNVGVPCDDSKSSCDHVGVHHLVMIRKVAANT